jgi:hypothetical protein
MSIVVAYNFSERACDHMDRRCIHTLEISGEPLFRKLVRAEEEGSWSMNIRTIIQKEIHIKIYKSKSYLPPGADPSAVTDSPLYMPLKPPDLRKPWGDLIVGLSIKRILKLIIWRFLLQSSFNGIEREQGHIHGHPRAGAALFGRTDISIQ